MKYLILLLVSFQLYALNLNSIYPENIIPGEIIKLTTMNNNIDIINSKLNSIYIKQSRQIPHFTSGPILSKDFKRIITKFN